jgi:hypothetical protein
MELHHATMAGLDTREGVDQDHGLALAWCTIFLLSLAQHLDDEEMFVEELVAVGEEFITMEALAILPVLSNFYRG